MATIRERTDAEALVRRLRGRVRLGPDDISTATVAAYQEPYDGHTVIVVWVADDREEEARDLLLESGAVLHPQPWVTRADIGASVPDGYGTDGLR